MKKLLLPLALVLAACTSEVATENAVQPDTAADAAAISGTHRVECGCALEAVGHCGNYVEVEGAWHEITGDVGLGAMEWCGAPGQSADVQGALVNGKFAAASVVTLQ